MKKEDRGLTLYENLDWEVFKFILELGFLFLFLVVIIIWQYYIKF